MAVKTEREIYNIRKHYYFLKNSEENDNRCSRLETCNVLLIVRPNELLRVSLRQDQSRLP